MSRRKRNPKKKWKRVVDNKMHGFGDIDFDKKIIRVNKKRSKNKPSRKRPINKGASKFPEVLDTILHEETHRKQSKLHEKTLKKKIVRKMKKMGRKQKQRLYKLYS